MKPTAGHSRRHSKDKDTVWAKFCLWCSGTKPTDVLSVLMALLSVVVAGLALHKADQVSQQQEDASAPVLAPGTPLQDRGKVAWVATNFAKVRKRLDRLYVDRDVPDREPNGHMVRVGRLVIPLENGGSGIALTMGRPVLVADCDQEPNALPATAVGALGTYSLPSGGSDQLGYVQRPTDKGGNVTVDGKSLWYSFDYKDFGLIGRGRHKPANLVIWYTDGAQLKLRWTCISYIYDDNNSRPGKTEWVTAAQQYGTRPMVPLS